MGSKTQAPLVEKTNAPAEACADRACALKAKGKIPKRIHKAEREKLKRDKLNELFLELANALDPNPQSNGKASILCEATRLLNDLFGQIESLKKENASLVSESHYVTIEKNELKEETSTLETEIQKLQNEIDNKVAQSKPDLNEPPPELQQSELSLPAAEHSIQQPSALIVVPIRPDIQAYPAPDLMRVPNSVVSKPHARYATPADSWPSQLLGKQLAIRNEFQLNNNICRTEDRSTDM